MDNKENQNIPEQPFEETDWFHELLHEPVLGEEIGVDEHAVTSAGLTHPNDAELDRIIQETLSEDWEEPQEEAPQPEAPFLDQEYRDADPIDDNFGYPPLILDDEEKAPVQEDGPTADELSAKRASRKLRPSPKKGYGMFGLPHILATVIWLVLVISIGVSLGRLVWLCAADLLAFGRDDKELQFIIEEGDDIDSIANRLKEEGLINYPGLFKFYLSIAEDGNPFSPGIFTVHSNYDYNALVNALTYFGSGQTTVDIMIPEGYTCAQIFQLLEEKGVCTAAELEAYAANGELNEYWFLEGVERGTGYCLEGYLFPDTYQFYTGDDQERVLEKFLDAFDDRFTDIMKERLTELNATFAAMLKRQGYSQDHIDSHKLTIREVVIIASMIEKESSGSDESYTISSVIYNRLSNPSFPYLQIDATIVYALGGKTDPLTEEDLLVDSPYNSYLNEGLIPGPIANPGRESLNAALMPEETNYYFYALDPSTEKHHFCETEPEFREFLNSLESNG